MIHTLTILEQQKALASGELSVRQLVTYYLERIEMLDRKGPCINSVIELNPDALLIASQRDDERRQGRIRGPLHGIPILIKDNIDTADQMCTTAGSLALEGHIAAQDAGLVTRLRTAGAILLGKTNLSEWANFRGKRSVSGWSSRGGQTRNPYALDRTPCGSSSGSGAAVAAGLCSAAIGTETDGSVTCPASSNGIVGFKPTLGMVSRSGIIPIAHSQDTAGPMARTVTDAAILLAAMSGYDPRDSLTSLHPGRAYSDYGAPLPPDGLKGVRLGVARKLAGFHSDVDALFEKSLRIIKSLGAEIVDPAEIVTLGQFDESEIEVLLYEFKADLNTYLGRLGPSARVHSLADVIAFNEANKERVMPFFGQEHMLAAEAKGSLSEPVYLNALAQNLHLSRQAGIDATLQQHRLDAILAPTFVPAPLVDFIARSSSGGGDVTSPPAVAGYPHITVPMGYIHGLPVGLSFVGTAWSEPTLLHMAYAFEQAAPAHQEPQFLPHARIEPDPYAIPLSSQAETQEAGEGQLPVSLVS